MNALLKIVSSSILSTFCSLVIAFVIPLKIGVNDFGYWQVFFLYSTFLGLFTFGFLDGIHLNYSGENNNNKEKLFKSYFIFLIKLLLIVFCILIIFIYLLFKYDVKQEIFYYLAINVLLFNLNGFFIHLSQVQRKISFYSISLVLDKLIFVVLILPLLFWSNENNYILLIQINLLSRIILLAIQIYFSKEIFKVKAYPLIKIRKKIITNFKRGGILTLSLLISIALLTYPRLIVEWKFSIETFSIFSLGLSVISMVIQIVSSVSAVLYAYIKSQKDEIYNLVINKINILLSYLSPVIFISYFIAYIIINNFLDNYSKILDYLFIYYPVIIFQVKNNLILLNSFKVFKIEKKLLFLNLVSLLMISFVFIISSLLIDFDVSYISFIFLICNIFSNLIMIIVLNKYSESSLSYPFIDILMTFIFIISCRFLDLKFAFIIMVITSLVYYLFNYKSMNHLFRRGKYD